MKNLTWQNPEQLFVAQELINKVKSKCCGIKDNKESAAKINNSAQKHLFCAIFFKLNFTKVTICKQQSQIHHI